MPGTNAPVSYQWDATDALEQQLGRKLDILQFFWGWNDAFPDAEFEGWAINHGATPLISWHGTALQPILDGQHDAWIRARARAVKALNAPVFIRWAWEMNGNWYPWDGYHNGANLAATEKYKAGVAPHPRPLPPGRRDQRQLGLGAELRLDPEHPRQRPGRVVEPLPELLPGRRVRRLGRHRRLQRRLLAVAGTTC